MEQPAEIDAPEHAAAALVQFFKDHRPLPFSTGYPDERASWYACTCKEWASAKTRANAEWHHIAEFERHCADVLIASGWRQTTVTPPAQCHASESAREICEQMSDDLPHIACPCGRAPGRVTPPERTGDA